MHNYRPDIDGLRGIAVLSVLVFHIFPEMLPSGFIGVDIFFVISGYLITGIILKEIDQERFSFLNFYARRIRRIFPALLLVIISSLIFGWGMLISIEFQQLSKHVAAASAFIPNFVFWGEAGYFDKVANSKPLLHLWSLGVEEQFYFFWPLLLVLFASSKIRATSYLSYLVVVACVIAVSFYLNIKQTQMDPAGAFYSPFPRFWELMIGASLAISTQVKLIERLITEFKLKPSLLTFTRQGFALLGFCLLGYGFHHITHSLSFPGWLAMLPVLGTALLIASGPDTLFHRYIFRFKPLVWVGLISYPLYLWHWTLFSFSSIIYPTLSVEFRLGLIVIAIIFSALTYFFIERPIRFGINFRRIKTIVLFALMIAVGIFGLVCYKGIIAPKTDVDVANIIADKQWTYHNSSRWEKVDIHPDDFKDAAQWKLTVKANEPWEGGIHFRKISSESDRKTLYLGDSHMEHFWSRVDQLILDNPRKTRTAVFITSSAFLPVPNVLIDNAPYWVGLADMMINYALSDETVENVVLSANWGAHLADALSYDEAHESSYYMIVDGKKQYLKAGRRANDLVYEELQKMIIKLENAGKKVFFVMTVVGGGPVGFERKWGKHTPKTFSNSSEWFFREYANLRPKLIELVKQAGATVIDPVQFMCPDGACTHLFDDNRPVYMDGSHVSDAFMRKHGDFLDETLLFN